MSKRLLILLPCILLLAIIGTHVMNRSRSGSDTVIKVTSGDEFKSFAETKGLPPEPQVSENITVDVKGEVVNPDVYELPEGSIVNDAIKAAGGFTEQADELSVNRAKILKNEDQIIVANKDDRIVDNTQSGRYAAGGLVNINTADAVQLETLPGIGEATARKIIDYRQANGQFETIEDICNVSGIGAKKFEQIKSLITV